ncbi:hypothetical protein [Alkaliphilus metalliredigens]|uniref:hypothetical protein n=1 Tax=Alkaliphilus metalliredigens TaxID=208226 RepID=UPI0005A2E64C|nr:hypothetical protein [Alkaliphilus metalliredigens]
MAFIAAVSEENGDPLPHQSTQRPEEFAHPHIKTFHWAISGGSGSLHSIGALRDWTICYTKQIPAENSL